jgi:hypothetical protein
MRKLEPAKIAGMKLRVVQICAGHPEVQIVPVSLWLLDLRLQPGQVPL